MKIGDLSRKSGVSRYSIHHYLRFGLLPEPEKKNKTIAYYGDLHLERLNIIKTLRAQGLSLYVIGQMISQDPEGIKLNDSINKDAGLRPVRKDKEIKRKEIIAAAGKIFSEKGFHGTNVSDITDDLGIGKSTFYLYFKNKKELFLVCIDDIFDNLWKEDFERVYAETDMRHRLALRTEAFIRVYPRIRDILQLMRGASVGEEGGTQKKFQEIYTTIVRPVKRDLMKLMEQGKIRGGDPELMAYALVGVAEALAYRVHMDGQYSIEDAIKEIYQWGALRLGQ